MNISPVKATKAVQSITSTAKAQVPVALEAPIQKCEESIEALKVKASEVFDKNGKLNSLIKKMLDESQFVFDVDGKSKLMTIKDYTKANIREIRKYNKDRYWGMYHATFTKEVADQIIKNGFDYKKISRAQHGPGIYLAFAEGQAMQYGSSKLRIDITKNGKEALLNPGWYKQVESSGAASKVRKFTGADSKKVGQAVNEYVRSYLADELGCNLGYANGELICFNPEVMGNIRHF